MVANPPSKNTERRILWFLIFILTLAILDLKSGERAKHTNDAAVMVEKNHQHKINSAQMPKVDVKDRDETMSSFRREEKRREEKGLSEGERQQEGLTCPGYQNPEKLEGKPSWFWIRTKKTASTAVRLRLLKYRDSLKLVSTSADMFSMDSSCSGLTKNADFHPLIAHHVAYRPCAEKLLRGYEDGNFVKFMGFRDPVAWKFGIGMRKCGNSTFLKYLQDCPFATDNHYLQMLDPEGMDITTALERLDDRVLILLQSDMDTSMELFKSILLDPVLPDNDFETKMEHVRVTGSSRSDAMPAEDMPMIQKLLDERTKYDQILYERALELFAFQNRSCRTFL